jgi:plasmid maintenance system antidote protein VapI
MSEYKPDYVSPPGDTIHETLITIGMTTKEFALRCGYPVALIHEIIVGKHEITESIAFKFEQVLNIPASFWMNREKQYQEARRRLIDRVDGL